MSTMSVEEKTPTADISSKEGCLFCSFAHGGERKTELLYEDENIVAFNDIRPASQCHFLVIPRSHHGNVKFMTGTATEQQLVENLVSVGRSLLEKRNMALEDARFGFHWAPFDSIEHLHLHVIAPINQMGFMARGIFLPNSLWFVTADWLMNRLRTLADTPTATS